MKKNLIAIIISVAFVYLISSLTFFTGAWFYDTTETTIGTITVGQKVDIEVSSEIRTDTILPGDNISFNVGEVIVKANSSAMFLRAQVRVEEAYSDVLTIQVKQTSEENQPKWLQYSQTDMFYYCNNTASALTNTSAPSELYSVETSEADQTIGIQINAIVSQEADEETLVPESQIKITIVFQALQSENTAEAYETIAAMEEAWGEIYYTANLNVNDVVYTYSYADGSTWQTIVEQFNNQQTEESKKILDTTTCGLFADKDFYQVADLTQPVTYDATLYTKYATTTGLTYTAIDETTCSVKGTTPADLTGEIVLPCVDSATGLKVTNIAQMGFVQSNLNSLIISTNINKIETGALAMSKLSTINIHSNVTEILALAMGSTNIEFAYLPATLQNVASDIFTSCASLIELINETSFSVTVPDTCTNVISSLSKKTYSNDGEYVTYTNIKTNAPTVVKYLGSASILTLPEKFKNYEFQYNYNTNSSVFSANTTLTEVIIPSAYTSIPSCAFYSCQASTIEIPTSVTHIGNSAFSHSGITSMYVPSSVKTMGNSAFYSCENLETIEFEDYGIEMLPNDALYGCYKIKSLKLPEGLTEVQNRAIGALSSQFSLECIEFPSTLKSLISVHTVIMSSSIVAGKTDGMYDGNYDGISIKYIINSVELLEYIAEQFATNVKPTFCYLAVPSSINNSADLDRTNLDAVYATPTQDGDYYIYNTYLSE